MKSNLIKTVQRLKKNKYNHIPIINYLFHRATMFQKGEFRWVKDDEEFMTDEPGSSSLRYYCKDSSIPQSLFVVNRVDGEAKELTLERMFVHIMSKISIQGSLLMERSEDAHIAVNIEKMRSMQMPNAYNVPPPFQVMTIPSEEVFPNVPSIVIEAYKLYDMLYFNETFGVKRSIEWWTKNIWIKSPGIEAGLIGRIVHVHSWYNRTFGYRFGLPNSYFSHYGLFTQGKITENLAKYSAPVKDYPEAAKVLQPLFGRSYAMMADWNGWDLYHERFIWTFAGKKTWDLNLYGRNSAGLRAGHQITIKKDENIDVVINVNGKKIEQCDYYSKKFNEACREVLEKFDKGDRINFPDNHFAVSMTEKRFVQQCVLMWACDEGDPIEEREKASKKLRDFNIPNMINHIASCWYHLIRHKLERGRGIKIGIKMDFGGAYDLAKEMHYDDPNMRYGDGDIRGLDRSIDRATLEFFIAMGMIYYDTDKMESRDVYLLETLGKFIAERLSVRVTHIMSDLWKIFYGGMPSGAFETSHGDSWIMMFYFFLFLTKTMDENPSYAAKIKQYLKEGKIGIIVYGDDHIIRSYVDVFHLISEKAFADFLKKYYYIETRDLRNDVSFFSVPDRYGGLSIKGLVFLQRYFVRNTTGRQDLPDVLAFRPLEKTIMRMGYGATAGKFTVMDYLLSCIGMAYDTKGVNIYGYRFCQHMFECISKEKPFNYDELLTSTVNITAVLKKTGIKMEDLKAGFPKLQVLLDRQVYDRTKNKFKWSNMQLFELCEMLGVKVEDPAWKDD